MYFMVKSHRFWLIRMCVNFSIHRCVQHSEVFRVSSGGGDSRKRDRHLQFFTSWKLVRPRRFNRYAHKIGFKNGTVSSISKFWVALSDVCFLLRSILHNGTIEIKITENKSFDILSMPDWLIAQQVVVQQLNLSTCTSPRQWTKSQPTSRSHHGERSYYQNSIIKCIHFWHVGPPSQFLVHWKQGPKNVRCCNE